MDENQDITGSEQVYRFGLAGDYYEVHLACLADAGLCKQYSEYIHYYILALQKKNR